MVKLAGMNPPSRPDEPLLAVLTPVANEADADTLARGAVAARLAAWVRAETGVA